MHSSKQKELRIYEASQCCVFRKTKELYGGLSNMASGYPIKINGIKILSSEALYQACRFPHLPDVQEKIIREKSPMSAKMVGKPFRNNSRPDWDEERIKIMRWCLKVKLAQNFIQFGRLLETTLDKSIVEDSSKDDFWGAIRNKENQETLHGVNALGRLLMELRKNYNENRYSFNTFVVEQLDIPDFRLFGKPIETVDERDSFLSFFKSQTKLSEIENLPMWAPESKNYMHLNESKNVVNEPELSIKGKNSEALNDSEAKDKKKKTKKKFVNQPTLPF
jgi:ribA/ribD-fused uncharacterized protein